jgi:nicotinamidase-related amidase
VTRLPRQFSHAKGASTDGVIHFVDRGGFSVVILLDPTTTALVLIDLQKGIVDHPLYPRTGDEIVEVASGLADRFREALAPVILVNIEIHKTLSDALKQPVDRPHTRPAGGYPLDWSEIVDELARPDDIRITKRQWSAFVGTNMDVQLSRRGIRTVVIGGIATNLGVESSARQAHEYGYEVVFVEDISASISLAMHEFAVGNIMPMISRVATSDQIRLLARNAREASS